VVDLVVAPDIFGDRKWDDGAWNVNPSFLVVSDDFENAAAALHAAAKRIANVDELGHELSMWEREHVDELYTPNFVSGVVVTDAGPCIWTDTKDWLSEAMGATMLSILSEELAARSVDAHVAAAPTPWESDREWWPADDPPASEVSHSWYVARWRRQTTSTGRPYAEYQYRCADGSWTTKRTQAERVSDRVDARPENPGGDPEGDWSAPLVQWRRDDDVEDPSTTPPSRLRRPDA
jgi:hypothetical protein